MAQSVFIETTIPSYLAARRSRDIIQAARQELTSQWWTQHRGRYKLFTSQVVLDEIARGDAGQAGQRIARRTTHGISPIRTTTVRFAIAWRRIASRCRSSARQRS